MSLFSKKTLIEYLSKIGQIESQYETKVQKTDKPVKEETKFLARSYWQIEVETAKAMEGLFIEVLMAPRYDDGAKEIIDGSVSKEEAQAKIKQFLSSWI